MVSGLHELASRMERVLLPERCASRYVRGNRLMRCELDEGHQGSHVNVDRLYWDDDEAVME
jgi:hypothetical protein